MADLTLSPDGGEALGRTAEEAPGSDMVTAVAELCDTQVAEAEKTEDDADPDADAGGDEEVTTTDEVVEDDAQPSDDEEVAEEKEDDGQTSQQETHDDEPPELPSDLLMRGAKLGISERVMKNLGEDAEAFVTQQETLVASKTEEAEVTPEEDPIVAVFDAAEEKIKALKEDGVDDDVAAVLDSLVEINKASMEKLQNLEANQGNVSTQSEPSADDSLNWFDDQVSAAGEEFAEIFGEGTRETVAQDSEQFKNRSQLWDETLAIFQGAQATNKPISSKEAFAKALKIVAPDAPAKKARKALETKVTKRASQIVEDPGGRNGPKTDPQKVCLDEITEIMNRDT